MSTILVIDEPDAARPLGGLLTAAGHRMITADNAWQGLAVLESHPIDLAVVNLDLSGLGGYTFLQDLRRNHNPGHRNLRVIGFTNSLDPQTRSQLKPLKVPVLLSRRDTSPFEFIDAVRAALSDPEGERWRYAHVA